MELCWIRARIINSKQSPSYFTHTLYINHQGLQRLMFCRKRWCMGKFRAALLRKQLSLSNNNKEKHVIHNNSAFIENITMSSFQFLIRSLNKENNHLLWARAAIWSTTLWNKIMLQLALRDSSHNTDNSVIISSPCINEMHFFPLWKRKGDILKVSQCFFRPYNESQWVLDLFGTPLTFTA